MTNLVLMQDYRETHDHGDPWGSAMSALFGIAAELWMRDDGSLPASWLYRPGAAADPRDPEDYLYETFKEADTEDLLALGELLNRYCDLLKRAECDY